MVGVVSALVVPNLKLKYEERILVSKYKQLYSMMNMAFNESVKQYGPVKYWDLESDVAFSSVKFIKYIIPAGLKVDYLEGKLPNVPVSYLHNKGQNKVAGSRAQVYKLKNGITFFPVYISRSNCSSKFGNDENNIYVSKMCGDFCVDLNGEVGPNTYGFDQFQFYVTQGGIIPVGIRADLGRPIKDYCNPKGNLQFNGYSCGAWILEKGTMPWLYGKQVEWD